MVDFFQKNKELIIATVIFLGISVIYFSPVVDGYSLKMGDIQNWNGMAKEAKDFKKIYGESALWTNTSFSGMPTYQIVDNYTNPLKRIYNTLIKLLSLPLVAFLSAFLSFYVLAKSFKVGFYIAMIGSIAYGLSTYNFLILEAGHVSKLMAIAFIPGVIGGFILLYSDKKWLTGFSLLTVFLSLELLVNHVQMTYYFIILIAGVGIAEFIVYAKRKEYRLFMARTGLVLIAVLISVLANFANYYNTYMFAKKTTRGNPVITIDANGNNVENNHSSGLNKDYIVQWSYGKSETWNLLIPSAKGDRTVLEKVLNQLKSNPALYNFIVENYRKSGGKLFGSYWGDQPFSSGPNYIGAIAVFLALLYLVFVRTPLKWALFGVSLLVLLLSWGKNLGGSVENMWLTNFFIDYVPLYSKFRTVSSILVVLNLTIPIMAILFLNEVTNNMEWAKKNFKQISLVGGLFIVLILMVGYSNIIGFSSELENIQVNQLSENYQSNPSGIDPANALFEIEELRKDVVKSDVWRSVGLMLVSLGLLLVFIRKNEYKKYALGGMALLVLFDMWSVDKRFLNNEKNPNGKRSFISWEKKSEFSNTFNAKPGDEAIYKLESERNAKIESEYERILSIQSKKERRNRKQQESAKFAALNFNTNYKVMDLDNPFNSARVSYFHKSSGGYNPAKLKRYQDVVDFYISDELSFLNSRDFGKMKVLNMLNNKYFLYKEQLFAQNPSAYGNAWFVKRINWVNTDNEEILAVANTDLKNEVIIHKEFKNRVHDISEVSETAEIYMSSYSPMSIKYETTTSTDALAVFSEVYYEDGWYAFIDGEKVDYARANYLVRALNIPKGSHIVEFKFEPTMFLIGNILNTIGFVLILTVVILSIYFSNKNKQSFLLNKLNTKI